MEVFFRIERGLGRFDLVGWGDRSACDGWETQRERATGETVMGRLQAGQPQNRKDSENPEAQQLKKA